MAPSSFSWGVQAITRPFPNPHSPSQFAHAYGLEFLPMRIWISIWMTAMVVVLSAFEGMTIVKHLTRFTEEIFSTLVCLIFIYGAFDKLVGIFMENPLLAEYCYEDVNNTEM